MRWLLFLILASLLSCAHHDELQREPSSEAEEFMYGDHDEIQSIVKEFPPEHHEGFTRHFYFVELKDQTSQYIDRDPHEFEVKLKGKHVTTEINRVLRGRYYITLESRHETRGQLQFFVAGKKLRESFKLGLKPADRSHSKMRLLRVYRTKAILELTLRDKNGRWVETPGPPEIILDLNSNVEIAKLEHMGNGIWQITLRYPEENQLLYISVRSHGVFFKNLFRFHYVDK